MVARTYSDADIQAVVDILRSDFLTQGPAVPAFENGIGSLLWRTTFHCGEQRHQRLAHCLFGAGCGPNDMAWTTPITFVASANLRPVLRRAGRFCGHRSAHLQHERRTLGLKNWHRQQNQVACQKWLSLFICAAQPCDMKGIHALSQHYGFKTSKMPHTQSAENIGGEAYRQLPL